MSEQCCQILDIAARRATPRLPEGQGSADAAPAWHCDDPVLPSRREGVHAYVVDGEAVLFDRERRQMYLLNQTALAIWNRCDGQTTLRRAALEAGRQFDTPFATMLDHTEELLALFSSLNLLNHGTD